MIGHVTKPHVQGPTTAPLLRRGMHRALQLWLIYCFVVGFLLGAGVV